MLPHNMMGLTDEQVEELKLKDEWGEKCIPMGGWTFNKDVIGTQKQITNHLSMALERTTDQNSECRNEREKFGKIRV